MDNIEQTAPTPWMADPEYRGLILDANGDTVHPSDCRDRILACVNFCKGLSMQELAQSRPCMGWGRKETKQQSQPPADAGFAQVSKIVKGLAQVSQLPGNERKPQ
jgi:hypothetical protein